MTPPSSARYAAILRGLIAMTGKGCHMAFHERFLDEIHAGRTAGGLLHHVLEGDFFSMSSLVQDNRLLAWNIPPSHELSCEVLPDHTNSFNPGDFGRSSGSILLAAS